MQLLAQPEETLSMLQTQPCRERVDFCGGKNQHVGGRKSPAWAQRELWSGESHSVVGWIVGLKGT